MRKFFFFLTFFLCLFLAKANEIETIKSRIADWNWNYEVNKPVILSNAVKWQTSLQSNFQWNDIDYTNPTRSTWTAFPHLNRIKEMTLAYTAPWSTLKNNDELFSSIQNALTYWNNAKLKNINWWWNEIQAPRTLGIILIMLDQNKGKKLTPEFREKLIQQMDFKRFNGTTGVNLADFDTHLFYSGLLTENDEVIQKALTNIFSINKKTVKEGVQFDNSYAQHEIMLHIFGYGSEYLKVETYIGAMVAGTKFAMKGEELKVFSNFIAKTLIPQIRGRYANFTSFGRQIARKNFTDMKWLSFYFEKLISMDSANEKIYRSAILRMNEKKKPNYRVAEFQKHFWNTDFGFYQNKNYQFSVRVSSIFTQQAETDLNGENGKGGYRSIGSYSVLQNGDEYFNIYPIWDWKKIPGTTVVEDLALPDTKYLTPGMSHFAGGVSNGKIGVTTFLQDQFDIKAKKSWFMFDGEIVCLGSGISSTSNDHVITNVEQNFFQNKVDYLDFNKEKQINPDKNFVKEGSQAFLHKNVAYIFPEKTNIKLSTDKQTGSWKDLSDIESDQQESGNVFKLWIDHGKQPVNAKYNYIIAPKTKKVSQSKKIAANFINVNQENVQAVYKKSSGQLMIVFFAPSEFEILGHKIKVDKACTILFEKAKFESPSFYISDPSRKEKEITITVDGKTINVKLPTDSAFAGSSVLYEEKA